MQLILLLVVCVSVTAVYSVRSVSLSAHPKHMHMLQGKLPPEFFEKQNIWLYRGNMYRLLVEPSDIANHYGLKSMSGVGHYLEGNRPGRQVA